MVSHKNKFGVMKSDSTVILGRFLKEKIFHFILIKQMKMISERKGDKNCITLHIQGLVNASNIVTPTYQNSYFRTKKRRLS